jgi:sugar diacid utilization regulator
VLDAAREANIPIRIGVNAGSLDQQLAARTDLTLPEKLTESAFEYAKFCEENGFEDLVVSAKAHDVMTTVRTYRLLAERIPHIPLHIGMSISDEDRPDIKKCYRQACQALLAAGVYGSEDRITSYENLGVASLLMDIEDTSLLKNFHAKSLGALIEYDKMNRTDLCRTLEIFYENNSDLQVSSQRLFIHKNTLKYRLERINEILGCNIRSTDAFLRIGVAFQVGRILSGKGASEGTPKNDMR